MENGGSFSEMLDDAMVVDKDDLNLYFPPDVVVPPSSYTYPITGKNYVTSPNNNCQYDPNYYHYGYATSPINSSVDATPQQQQQSNYQVQPPLFR